MKQVALIPIGLLCIAIMLLAATVITQQTSASQLHEERPAVNGNYPDYMMVGNDDVLYAFKGSSIFAIGSNGSHRWQVDLPTDQRAVNFWRIPWYTAERSGGQVFINSDNSTIYSYPAAAEDSGSLYVYVLNLSPEIPYLQSALQGNASYKDSSARLIAISPQGRILWSYPVPARLYMYNDRQLDEGGFLDNHVGLQVQGGKIYFHHGSQEDVLSKDGKVLFTLDNITYPVAIDVNGTIFAVRSNDTGPGEEGENPYRTDSSAMPSTTIEAYNSDGRLLWSNDTGHFALGQPIFGYAWPLYSSIPLYANDTLYIPTEDGVMALDTNGRILWYRKVPFSLFSLYPYMPIDRDGNVYLTPMTEGYSQPKSSIYTIDPNGRINTSPWTYSTSYTNPDSPGPYPLGNKNGITYTISGSKRLDKQAFETVYTSKQFDADRITAWDVKTNTKLWDFSLPMEDRYAGIINASNAPDELRLYDDRIRQTNQTYSRLGSNGAIQQFMNVRVFPGDNITYIGYYYALYESPIVENRSRIVEAGGIYAIDNRGNLLRKETVNGFLAQMAANNSTFYYSTDDGRIGRFGATWVVGLTAAASSLFIFFLAAGAVTRKGLPEHNENRKRLLKYAEDHPGATAIDITKGLGMNIGTVRYHLLVLSLNHELIVHRDSQKYTRYFRSSAHHTSVERSLVALIRREPIRKTLQAILERPGVSSTELSRALGLSATATHRHVGLLVERGIVDRTPTRYHGFSYQVNDGYRPQVQSMMDIFIDKRQ
ncbi:MAG TPA: winged helix-turn-helix transcriptional regulator [Methanocella sp.]|nr:winged helix-turn-helix transcriptional regulator [Methanocella sp.]